MASPPVPPVPPPPPVYTVEEIERLRTAANLSQEINLLTENRLSRLRAIVREEEALQTDMEDLLNNLTVQTRALTDMEQQRLQAIEEGNNRQALALEAAIFATRQIIEADKERAKELAKTLDILKQQREETENRATAIEKERLLGKEILEGMKNQMASTIGLGTFVDKLNSGFSVGASLVYQMYENAKKLFDAVMTGNQQFAAATGQIADRSIKFGYGASQFGVGFEEMNKAATELFVNMANFSNMSREVQEGLAVTAAKMELFGVSASTVGKNLEGMTLALNMTTSDAKQSLETMTKAAMGAGIAPKKMQEEFAANLPKLAAYGKQALDVYIDLQKEAKALGMELNTLNGIIGDQFDTFEGAAKAAGKFNAVLGGNYLNSVEMLNATESERIILLKRSFEESGKNFDLLSKYEKKAVAATLGITDLNEASKLFNKSTAELEIEMQKRNATDEEQARVQREAADVSKQTTQIFNSLLIVIRPLVTATKNVVEVFAAFVDLGDGIVGQALGIATAFYILYKAWGALDALGKTKLGVFTVIVIALQLIHYWLLEPHSPILFFALLMLPFIITAIGRAAEASEKGLYALGAAFMMIGAGVYLATTGLTGMVEAFGNLAGGQIIGAVIALTLVMGGFIAMLSILAGVSTAAALPMLGVGAAFLMIGAGIGIAALGIAQIIEKMGELVSTGVEGAIGLLAFSVAIQLLISSLLIASSGALFAVAGLAIISGAIYAIGESINNIEENKLIAFKDTMHDFLELLKFEGVEEKSSIISDSISSIGKALENIPEGKTVALETLNRTLTVAKSITEDNIKPTRDFIQVMKGYYEVQATAKEADKDALVAALKEITGAITSNREEETKEISLVVKGSEMADLFKGKKKTVAGLLTGPIENI